MAADEAVVRVVLQDAGGGGTAPPPGDGPPSGGGEGGERPPEEYTRERELLEAEAKALAEVTKRQQEAIAENDKRQLEVFAKEIAAIEKRADREEKLFELEAQAFLKVSRDQQALVEEQWKIQLDKDKREKELIELEAQAHLKVEQARVAKESREQKLFELEAQAFLKVSRDQQALVDQQEKAQLDKEKREKELIELEARAALQVVRNQQAAANRSREEYLQSLPEAEAVIDPELEARKRRVREIERAQVDAAYKKLYGEQTESGTDQFLKVADSLRGTLGGIFGQVAGSVLDVISAVRKSQVEKEKEQREKDLLAEAGKTTEAVENLSKPKPPRTATQTGSKPPVEDPNDFKDEIDAAAEKAAGGGGVAGGGGGGVPPVAEMVGAAEGGGAMASVAAAAGPIAAIAAAVFAAKAVMQNIVSGIINLGAGIAGFAAEANPDPAVSIGKLGSAAQEASNKLEYVSPALSLLTGTIGDSINAFAGLMQAINQTANRYGEYSPEITQAQAIAEITQTMGDMRRAQEVSAEMAKYLAAQSDVQQKFEDIKVKILVQILPTVTRILNILDSIMPSGAGIEAAVSALAGPLIGLLQVANEILNIQDNERFAKPGDPTDMIIGKNDDGTYKFPMGQIGFVPKGD